MKTTVARAAAMMVVSAAFSAATLISASAAPLLDPDNDGVVTADEILTAPLVPQSYAPGRDANDDGAISIGEATGIAAPGANGTVFSRTTSKSTWTGRTGLDPVFIDGPDGSRWKVSQGKNTNYGTAEHSLDLESVRATVITSYKFSMTDAAGNRFDMYPDFPFPGRSYLRVYDSADPTIVRIDMTSYR